MSLPYYKRYTRDLIDGTIGMGFELKLTYAFVIDLIMHHDGKLRDNPRYIAGVLECSVRKWNKLRSDLIEMGKIYVENDFIFNFRATFEAESLSKYRDKQAENGRKSNKNKGVSKNSLKPKLNHTDTDTDTELSNKLDSARKKKKPRATQLPEGWRPKPLSKNLKEKLNLTQKEYQHEFSQFTDHAAAKGRKQVDWDAAWRQWLQSPYGTYGRRLDGKSSQGSRGPNASQDGQKASGLGAAIQRNIDAGQPEIPHNSEINVTPRPDTSDPRLRLSADED